MKGLSFKWPIKIRVACLINKGTLQTFVWEPIRKVSALFSLKSDKFCKFICFNSAVTFLKKPWILNDYYSDRKTRISHLSLISERFKGCASDFKSFYLNFTLAKSSSLSLVWALSWLVWGRLSEPIFTSGGLNNTKRGQ